MRVDLFAHSFLSDWNHGNAHFLRGVATDLALRGHDVRTWEPDDAWSYQNFIATPGSAQVLERLSRSYPRLHPVRYHEATLDLDRALAGTDLVIVHEWNSPSLVGRIGAHRARAGGFQLLFHDTHHRSVSGPSEIARYDLSSYDGVLAFGRVIRDIYLRERWARRAFIWHEAADTRVFQPRASERAPHAPDRADRTEDLVWVGNWGDGERSDELREFLLDPVSALGLRALVHGVRYPPAAIAALEAAGVRYGGFLPNVDVPSVFARGRATVHVPRRHYASALPGIPTIRVFEALACGIPLVCAPWDDVEGLFSPGEDYLVARTGAEMREHLRRLVDDPAAGAALAARGLATIEARHTCAHRVDELLAIVAELSAEAPARTPASPRTVAVSQGAVDHQDDKPLVNAADTPVAGPAAKPVDGASR